jgi:hypothetical protein
MYAHHKKNHEVDCLSIQQNASAHISFYDQEEWSADQTTDYGVL